MKTISAGTLIAFGFGIIIHPLASFIPLFNLIGLFFLIYGVSFILDALEKGISGGKKDSFKRKIRINHPVFMVALIPHQILTKINKALKTDTIDHENLYQWEPKSKIVIEKGWAPDEPYTDYASIVYDNLISPGAYFEYFNPEFYQGNSMVISRKIYYNTSKKGKKMVKS